MATAGNWYSFSNTHFPQTMTNMAGDTQYGLVVRSNYNATVYKRTLPTPDHPTDDRYSTYALETISGNPLGLPLNSSDSHYHLALAVDAHDCVHIAGNGHQPASSPLRYVKSDAADITTWTAGVYSTIGGGFTSLSNADAWEYQIFNRLTDGTLLWFFNRQPTTGNTIGRDWYGMKFASTATSLTQYTPLIAANGQFATCSDTAVAGVEAQWVYITGVEVTDGPGGPGTDRVHVTGVWRTYVSVNGVTYGPGGVPSSGQGDSTIPDPPSQQQPFYMYSDDITDATAWKTIGGSKQTMPITWQNRAAATITSAPSYSREVALGMAIDKTGYPHVTLRDQDTTNWKHCWWSGFSWNSEDLFSPGSAAVGAKIRRIGAGTTGNDELWIITKAAGGRIRVRALSQPSGSFLIGDVVDNAATAIPNPDPILLRSGVMDIMIPNGSTAANFQFGNHNARPRRSLHSGAESATGNGVSLDNTTATANGASAVLHLTKITGSPTITVIVQDSTNAALWTTLLSFTARTTVGVEKVIVASGTVKRYVRASWTVTGTGTASFTVGFDRSA